jgi:UPF0042 nucleotide-binding protein
MTTRGILVGAVLTSFGYAHRTPPPATVTLDTRALLRDPHINPALRALTGHHPAVQHRVLTTPGAARLIQHTTDLVDDLLADAGDPTGTLVTVAIGCVGGRHRSVALTEAIAAQLAARGVRAEVEHLDVDQAVIDRNHPTAPPR